MNIGQIANVKAAGDRGAHTPQLCIDHILIRQELKYLIGAQIVTLKSRVLLVKPTEFQ